MPQKLQPASLRTLGDIMSESMGDNISESLGGFVGISSQTEEEGVPHEMFSNPQSDRFRQFLSSTLKH